MRNELLKNCFVLSGSFISKVIPDLKVTIKQPTVKEHSDYEKMMAESPTNPTDAIYFAVQNAMVEPAFFTADELLKLSKTGQNFLFEVFGEIPIIGKTQKEREEYQKKMTEIIAQNDGKSEDKESAGKK